jgi:hypothetical protein
VPEEFFKPYDFFSPVRWSRDIKSFPSFNRSRGIETNQALVSKLTVDLEKTLATYEAIFSKQNILLEMS